MSPALRDLAVECEVGIFSKFAKIIQVALACSSDSNSTSGDVELNEGERAFGKRFLRFLISLNNTLMEPVEEDMEDGPGFDLISSRASFGVKNSSISLIQSGGNPPAATAENNLKRLKHLELIKVGVLIAVISIIMLTTCRMIFRLFIRFRPEKPQD